jgi:hypothetical protein
VYVHGTDSYTCECYDSNVGGMNQALSVGAKIDVSISGLELGRAPPASTSCLPAR